MGATPADWAHWQGLNLTADMLPVVSDTSVPISATSRLEQIDGKTPTQIDGNGQVVGIPGWSKRITTAREIERWANDGRHGIGLVGRQVKAFDIDIDDAAAAGAVRDFIEMTLGALPCRRRSNSGKCLLVFRMAEPMPKSRILTADGVIELLGERQQFLLAGMHKSGVRYEWDGGLPAEIPTLTPAEVETVREALAAAFGAAGGVSTDRQPIALRRGRHAADSADPDVQTLYELGVVLDEHSDGKLDVQCPWEDEHTPGGSQSATTYFPRGLGGEEQAGFKCLHAHCAGRTIFDFRRAVGLDMVADDFGAVVDAATGELVEISSPKHSDDQLALGFAASSRQMLRFTPGMGWMSAGEHHWGRDDHLHRMTIARSICRDAAALADKPHERRALASARTVNAVVTLAQSDPRLLVPASAWDADAFALNTPGGVVDLRTGTMRPRAGDLVTRAARVSPNFEAACPNWLRFLETVCAGDATMVDFLQRMLGYMLTGDRREQKLFFIWGKGSNGKSTLGELLLWLLGGYGLKLSASVLMQSAHDRHPTELAQLHGVRAAMSSELDEGQFFNESRVKELTGDDTLSARFMGRDFFQFAISHKHLIIGNHKPRLKGGDPAMARRMVLIPFTAAFSGSDVDQEMPAKLRAEAPAILAWMVRGAVAWRADGLALPAVVRAASDAYMAEHNDVEQWLEDWCERAVEYRDQAGKLYESFSRWKLSRGERAPSAVTWAERMSLIPGLQKIRSNGAHYVGVRLTTGADACEFA